MDTRSRLARLENGNAYLGFGLDRRIGGFRGPVNQIMLVGRLSQVEQQTPTAEALNLTVEGSNPSGPATERSTRPPISLCQTSRHWAKIIPFGCGSRLELSDATNTVEVGSGLLEGL